MLSYVMPVLQMRLMANAVAPIAANSTAKIPTRRDYKCNAT